MGFSIPDSTYQFRPDCTAQQPWTQSYTYSETSDKLGLASSDASLRSFAFHADVDRQSNYSDDTESVTGSIFDGESTVSSQSSYGSAGDSEDSSDGENIPSSHARLSNATSKSSSRTIDDHPDLLSGLGATSIESHQAPLPCPNRFQSSQASAKYAHVQQSAQKCTNTAFKQPHQVPQKANRRRSVQSDHASAPPCKLKRDTDSADCFVMLLISKSTEVSRQSCLTLNAAFAAKLITAFWPLSACPPMMSSCFNGAGVLPLEVFIHETLRRSKTSYSTLQVALWYLMLLKCKMPNSEFTKDQGASNCRAMQCGRRMFLAALMLASKYLQDRNYSTRAWSKISGLRICEINENEMKYLETIDYRLHITKDVFDNWSRVVLSLSKISKLKPGCPLVKSQSRMMEIGNMSVLTEMADNDYAAPDMDMFSNQWWCKLLAKLDPKICDTEDAVQSFLEETLPTFDTSNPMLKMDQGMAFGSPFDKSQLPFGNMSLPAVQSGSATPVQASEMAGRTTTLPLRPQPRNLPTPTSTPGASVAPSWLATPQYPQVNLRCSASVDALRSIRKLCFANANLERCPPPRPQSYHAPLRSRMRPAESYPSQGCPTPSISSPATSLASEGCSRSRSSSISSTSSWTSSHGASLPKINMSFETGRLPAPSNMSPLTRIVSMPESRVPGANAVHSHPLRRKPQLSDISAARHAAMESRSTTVFDVVRDSQKQNVASESDAVEALLRMRAMNQQISEATKPAPSSLDVSHRGHKRTLSHAMDSTQSSIRGRLMQEVTGDDIMSGPAMKIQDASTSNDFEKHWQKPSRGWAMPKKPVLTLDHKRVAMYCAPQGQVSAPDLASLMLKEHLSV
jgi:hypothetical protein